MDRYSIDINELGEKDIVPTRDGDYVLYSDMLKVKADADRLAEAIRTNIKDVADYVDDGSDLNGADMPYFRASSALERIRAALKAHEGLDGYR